MIKKIKEVIPEKNIIILSPHYDDVPLTFGGYLNGLTHNQLQGVKNIRIVHIFSRSNYQVRDDEGNRDHSMKRIQFATGIRLLEDLNCLDELIGKGHYSYEIKAERECAIRQKKWKPGEAFEFPQGDRNDFDDEDWQIFNRIKNYSQEWLQLQETALLLPIGMKEHIDHIILREAVMESVYELIHHVAATIYFGEDQPYTGLADEEDWAKTRVFLNTHPAERIDYPIDEIKKADQVMNYYPSQVEESYREGIINRSIQLKEEHKSKTGIERMYRLKRS
jgi:hypothetical protein